MFQNITEESESGIVHVSEYSNSILFEGINSFKAITSKDQYDFIYWWKYWYKSKIIESKDLFNIERSNKGQLHDIVSPEFIELYDDY